MGLLKIIPIIILKGYRLLISPLFPASCRYEPTCSHYAEEAFRKHGLLWGFCMSLWRLLRCNPFSKGGFDPIPKSVKEWRQSFSRSKSNE